MDFTNYTIWELYKINVQLNLEITKRIWWVLILLIAGYVLVFFGIDFWKERKRKRRRKE